MSRNNSIGCWTMLLKPPRLANPESHLPSQQSGLKKARAEGESD